MLSYTVHPASGRPGFTLVELLVVMSILLMLGGLLVPVILYAQNQRDKNANAGLLHNVDKALQIFKSRNGFGVSPAWKAGHPAADYGNHLFFKLSTQMTDTMKIDYKTRISDFDADRRSRYPMEIVDPFRGDYTWGQWSNSHDNELNPPSWNQSQRWRYYNNLLTELKKRDLYILKADMFTSDILNTSDIGQSNIGMWTDADGATHEAVLDVFGNPLIYAYRYDPGVDEKQYSGDLSRGFKGVADITTLDMDGKITNDSIYIDVVEGGRQTITDGNGDGQLEDDWATSDIRSSAVAGYEKEHELWSAGPDGVFDAVRGAVANEDNLSIHPDNYR